MGRVGRLVVLVVGGTLASGAACPEGVGGVAGPEESAIGRMCAADVPREVLAAEAIASAYRLQQVRDLQLVETGQAGTFLAVYRLGPEDARPQELFAATVVEEPGCVAVVAQGEACDPLAFSPIYLPRFGEGTVLVLPAELTEWEAMDEPVVTAGVVAAASEPEPGFPEARAVGRCIFRLFSIQDGRLAPETLFSWAESAYTVEWARNGREYTTETATAVSAVGGVAPRDLTAESVVADVECQEVPDRKEACVERCVARAPAVVTGDIPDSAEVCGTECAEVAAEPGRWCEAAVDRVTQWLDGREDETGRVSFEPTGEEEAISRLDAECILRQPAEGEVAAPLAERVEGCRVGENGEGEPGNGEQGTGNGELGTRN
ncbi:MAG: hypothetical protein HY905_19550 [Deltaproteobacteria bacterium]|nr:hypothetical protein [Deltaproteobacteria bacterium]